MIDHFTPRLLDWPLVGEISHAKKMDAEEYMYRIEKAISGHLIAEGELIGLYERR